MPGWTLAVDIPVKRSSLARTFDRFDEMVRQAGRVYRADARTRPEHLGSMYPRLDEWKASRTSDPDQFINRLADSRL